MENYYNELPEGYELKKEIDATDKKTGIIFNVFALIIMAVLIIGLFFIKNIKIELGEENLGKYYIYDLLFYPLLTPKELIYPIQGHTS